MKKILIAALIFVSIPVMAAEIFRSSQTATADSAKALCTEGKRGYLYNVCVSSAIAATGITVYNSSFTTAVQNTGFVSTASVGCYEYLVGYPSGLMYTKTGTANVTIAYDCY